MKKKIVKNLGFLYKIKYYLSNISLLVLYYSLIYTNINYGNIYLVFMHKIKSQTAPKIFQNKFRKPTHKYRKNLSTSNYSILLSILKSKYWISIRGLTLRKNIPRNFEKMQESATVLKILSEKNASATWKWNIMFLNQIA